VTQAEVQAALERARQVVEDRVSPDGTFEGWSGREVLCHLAAYAKVIGGALQGVAEGRPPTNSELYGRELTDAQLALSDLDEINAAVQSHYAGLTYDEALAFWRAVHAHVMAQAARLTNTQLAMPGPPDPPNWSRPALADVVTALVAHYEAHMAMTTSLTES
jgi:hypothetical protein